MNTQKEIINSFVDLLKLPPTILTVLAGASGAIIFLPNNIVKRLGFEHLQNPYKMILGLTFLISFGLLIVYTLKFIYSKMLSIYYLKRFEKDFPLAMKKLSVEEKKILAFLYQLPNLTFSLPSTDGLIIRLRSKLMIQYTSNQMIAYGDDLRVPFTITPVAVKYIDEHPDFLSVMTKEEVEELSLYSSFI